MSFLQLENAKQFSLGEKRRLNSFPLGKTVKSLNSFPQSLLAIPPIPPLLDRSDYVYRTSYCPHLVSICTTY